MKPGAWVAIFFALGCASDEPATAEERLIGGWGTETRPCATFAFFGADGEYEAGSLCALQGGTLGAEMEEGAYEVDGSTLRFTPMRSSCRSLRTAEPYELQFDFPTERSLRVRQPSGVTLLERLEADGEPPTGGVPFGCNEAGQFSREELGPF